MYPRLAYLATASLLVASSIVSAHPGRRFEIVIVGDQLAVQGYNSVRDDGPGVVRPYYNALHDHWSNSGVGQFATSDLPSFDVFTEESSFVAGNSEFSGGAAAQLAGATLTLDLQGAFKWTTPTADGPVELTPLGAEDPVISVGSTAGFTTSDELGEFVLTDDIRVTGAEDLDLDYQIGEHPGGQIYVLQWVLSADNGLQASESIYTILSPDPSATNGFHHPSLNAERQLGIAIIPEPTTGSLAALAGGVGCLRRRRRVAVS